MSRPGLWSRWFGAIVGGALLAGCSGGGGSLTPTAPGTPGSPAGPIGSMRLTISIPVASRAGANRKHPAFIVAATNGLEIDATNAAHAVIAEGVYDVSPTSPSCTTTGGLRSCSLALQIQIGGPYTFTLTSYDQAPAGGAIPGTANVLAVGVMTNATVVQGAANTFNATLEGRPATPAFATARTVALLDGTTTHFSVPVGVNDASGTAIVGAYSTPLTASVSDAGGHTTLSIDGGATRSSSVQLTSSTDAAALVAYYDGGGSAGYTASVTVSGTATSTATTALDTFAVTGTVGFGTPGYANDAATFTAPGQILFLTPAESNFAGTFTRSDTCSGNVTVAPSGPAFELLSVTATTTCHVDISDGTLTFSVPVTVTTTGASIGIPPPSGTVTTMATLSAGMSPFEIVNGPDAKRYFAANDGTDGELGSVDGNGTLHEYPIAGSTPVAVAVGLDGRIWSGDANDGFVRAMDTTSHAIATYDLTSNLGFTGGIAAGPDGDMWVTDGTNCDIDLLSTAGTFVNQVNVPLCGALSDIMEGPDGNMWVGDQISGQIARIDPVSHVVTRFPSTYPSGVGRLTVGHDGAIWFSLIVGGGLGRITTAGAYTFYPTASVQPEFGVVSAPDTTLIFSSCDCSGGLSRMTTGGAESAIANGVDAFDLAVGSDGGVWFTDYGTNTIGRVQP